MSEKTRAEMLRQMDFFHEFTDEHLQRLAAISEEAEFQSHQQVFQEHDPADQVYLVVSGKLSLAICAPKIGCRQIAQATPGELVGWSPLLGRPRLSDTATALVPTKLLRFNGSELLKLCDDDHELGYRFMKNTATVLGERLGATRVQLFNASGSNLSQVRLESD